MKKSALHNHQNGMERSFSINFQHTRAAGDESAVYIVKFSSNDPQQFGYDHYKFVETLMHGNDNADLSRLNDGGILLFNHDRNMPIGKINRAWIENGAGMAEVEFAATDKAMEVKALVDSGVMKKLSVGFIIRATSEVREEVGGEVIYTINIEKWEALEISMVTVPQDNTTSINATRDFHSGVVERLTQTLTGDEPMNPPTPTISVDEADAQREAAVKDAIDNATRTAASAAEAEETRQASIDGAAEISALPAEIKLTLVRAAKRDKTSVVDFNKILLDEATKHFAETQQNPNAEIGMSQKEIKRYSVSRAIGYLSGAISESEVGLEIEATRALCKKFGITQRAKDSIILPYEIQTRRHENIHQRENTPVNSADLIGVDFRPQNFIENLRDNAKVLQAGVTVLPGLNQDIKIPKKDSSAAFTYKAGGANTGDDTLTFSDVELSMKSASGAVAFSRDLVLRGLPQIEGIVMNDLARGAALLIDSSVLTANGTSPNPTGILNTTGIGSVTTTADALTWAQVIAFETALAEDNALMGNPCFFMSPGRVALAKQTLKASAVSGWLMDADRMMNGYKVMTDTSAALGSRIIFGNFADVILGVWNMLELVRDTAASSASGGIVIRAWTDVDVAVRHPESFAASTL